MMPWVVDEPSPADAANDCTTSVHAPGDYGVRKGNIDDRPVPPHLGEGPWEVLAEYCAGYPDGI
jgi:hypothetical protein